MRNLSGIAGIIILVIVATIFYYVGIVVIIALLCFCIYLLICNYSNKKKIQKSSHTRKYNDFLEEISDVDLLGIENSDLLTSIIQIFNEFGEGIITDKRFLSILSDKFSFKNDPQSKQIIKYFVDKGFLNKLSNINTDNECMELLKNYFDMGTQQFPNQRDSMVLNLMTLAYSINSDFIADTIKNFHSGNEVIPANQNHAKIIVRMESFEHSKISIHDIIVIQHQKETTIKFEITAGEVSNKEANYQDESSCYHVCCLFFNKDGFVIGKSVLASNYNHYNLLQIVNAYLYGIRSIDIFKIIFYVEKGCDYHEFDQMNSGPYKYQNQIPYTEYIREGNNHFYSLTNLIHLETSYNSHIVDVKAAYHQYSTGKGEIILFMELEYYGDKSIFWNQILIYDKKNLLKQKIALNNSYTSVNMYHYYTYFHNEISRLDYDDIGRISICNSNL